eukprot:SAG11_NODE_1785_length_4258_cov_5.997836_6_plen_284_part_00
MRRFCSHRNATARAPAERSRSSSLLYSRYQPHSSLAASSGQWYESYSPCVLSLRQHQAFEQREPSLGSLQLSTRFLAAEVPVRLHTLHCLAQLLPAEAQLLHSTARWRDGLHVLCEKYHASAPAASDDWEHIAQLLDIAVPTAMTTVEQRLGHMAAEMQPWLVAQAAARQAALCTVQPSIDAFFGRAYFITIGLRVMWAQHERLRRIVTPEAAPKEVERHVDFWHTRPKERRADLKIAHMPPPPPIISRVEIVRLIGCVVEDTRAFAREKVSTPALRRPRHFA